MSQLFDDHLKPRLILNMTKAEEWLAESEKYSDGKTTIISEEFQSPAALSLYLPSTWFLTEQPPGSEEYYNNLDIIQNILRAAQELQILKMPDSNFMEMQEVSHNWYTWIMIANRYADLRLSSPLLDMDDLHMVCETEKLSGKDIALMILKEATYQGNIIFDNLMQTVELVLAETCKDSAILNRLADSDEYYTRESVLENPNTGEEGKVLATLKNMQG